MARVGIIICFVVLFAAPVLADSIVSTLQMPPPGPEFTPRELEVCAYTVRAASSAKAYGGWQWAEVPLWVWEEVCLTDLSDKEERDSLMGNSVFEMEDWAVKHREWRLNHD